jgi:hypothetical protein
MKTARAMETVALTAVTFAGAQTGHTSTEPNKLEGLGSMFFLTQGQPKSLPRGQGTSS